MKKCMERLEKASVATTQELLFTVKGRIKEFDHESIRIQE